MAREFDGFHLLSPKVSLSSCSVLVSLYRYCFILYTDVKILAVLVINNRMFVSICELTNTYTLSKKFKLPYLLVLSSFIVL